MKEEFLHFVWESRSYDGQAWTTFDGAPVEVVEPGTLNRDQGPDFLNAHVRIGGVDYFGHVEIHLDGRDWYRHGHHKDPFYNPVVLHVVLKKSPDVVLREDRTCIPEVSLEGRIAASLLERANGWMNSKADLPCAELLGEVPAKLKGSWLGKCGDQRFRDKMSAFEVQLKDPELDWSQVLWEALAAAIGGPVNGSAFRCLAERLPVRLLMRYASFPESRESLLFGMAGFLEGETKDSHQENLANEWTFLRYMHQLEPAPEPVRFHRMRPAAFPTLRLSQLGLLAAQFPRLTDLLHPDCFGDFLRAPVHTHPYWESHLRFGNPVKKSKRVLGPSFLRVLFLNCLVPLGLAYARAHGDDGLARKILDYPRLLSPESNRITRKFTSAGIAPHQAQHSQGMVHLHQNYCQEKRCLECNWGRWMLRSPKCAGLVA